MRTLRIAALLVLGVVAFGARPDALAMGEGSALALRGIDLGESIPEPHPTSRARLSWAMRTRTSVATTLDPGRIRLDDPELFDQGLVWLSADRAFPPRTDAEIAGLQRFVDYGGMVVIDDARGDSAGFDASVRRMLRRAFPGNPLSQVSSEHVVYRSFYLVNSPAGRVAGPGHVDAITRDGRLAVIYSHADLSGAYARDDLGTWRHRVTPGGDEQREMAFRFGVNLIMYALCLDYKDDQVHAPFIMRRRGRAR